MATWEQRMLENEEEGLAANSVPEDPLQVLTVVHLLLPPRPQDAPRDATPTSTREDGGAAGEHLLQVWPLPQEGVRTNDEQGR